MFCQTCPCFFAELNTAGQGECRCKSPQVTSGGRGVWPKVEERDWCSEHPSRKTGETTGVGSALEDIIYYVGHRFVPNLNLEGKLVVDYTCSNCKMKVLSAQQVEDVQPCLGWKAKNGVDTSVAPGIR